MKGYKYNDYEIDIKKDMSIFLYTDGITEARNIDGNMFGDDMLQETLKGTKDENMEDRCSYIVEKLDDFVGNANQFDDITMLTLKINKEDGNADTIKCNADLDSLKNVKKFLENFIRDKDLSKKLEKNIFVITDEIFSNIAFYSRATKTMVSIKHHKDGVYLTFWDDGIAYNPLEKEDPDVNLPAEKRQIGGLGLYIVKQMAEDVKYERVSGNNVLKIVLKEKA